jgi:N-acetylglucosamine-6-phosphate deacetylase
VLVRDATLWTCGPEGVLEGADLLAVDGKIVRIGSDLEPPTGAVVIDARGKHVTPGLIDAHSHSDIVGGVNEFTNTCTAEVRIADVVNSQSIAIYRELAGGLTISNLLHGSANAIGGQNAVIKLRWGQPPSKLFVDDAPGGIKFALGENPKRSNWSAGRDRYPKTRMGVEQAIRERFLAALDYMRARNEYDENRKSQLPPKRDLQLDALVEVLRGERLVHSHSYRQDEILMLLRVAEDFGFRIGTFQHVLEGYKVADELAAGKAGASTFSDWWAYKFEVYDAIPHNGTIMWERDVVVSFNSDSSELARRMNLEAAKAVKYGQTPESEALKFVTLNPAKQLGIDSRVGSLEVGKDADFVVWSGDPLSTYTICEQTWIEGQRYFDRERDLAARDTMLAQREALLQKAEESGDKSGAGDAQSWEPSYLDDVDGHSCKHDEEVRP